MRHIIFIIALLFMGLTSPGQTNTTADDQRLAYSYYNNKEYDKAAYLFEKLFGESKSRMHFNYLINCMTRSNEYDKAEKTARKQLAASKNDPCYRVILGNIYKAQGNHEKAQQEFSKAIDDIRPNRNSIIELANQFLSAEERDLAERALIKGQELTSLDLSMELFSVYSSNRNFKMMSEMALNIIEKEPSQIFTMQSQMQYYLNNDINEEFYKILVQQLQQRIQQNPLPQYSEMMIWLQVLKKNFKMAIIQAKALDKRMDESGARLINIGELALQAKNYPAAADAYKYVLSKGKENSYYQKASFGVLQSVYEQVKDGSIADMEQYQYLENQYATAFADFGLTAKTVGEILNYANLETYYLNKPDSAQSILEQAINVQGISYLQKAQLTLQLGDVLLYKGEPWDALMTYAKVENDNKQNEYGDEAKFRKAKVAYYTGNFQWAASQLDVLKAATTKLVANDAMELSLLISDNAERESEILGDTTSAIMESEESCKDLRIYARADMYAHQNLHAEAIASLDTLVTKYKTSPLVDEALYMKASIYEKRRQMDSAAVYFKKVADEYAYDILADKACYRYAQIAERQLSDSESAKKYYMRILADYPGSIYAVESRERYRKLSGE